MEFVEKSVSLIDANVSDDEAVRLFNASLPLGLKLMNARFLSASSEHGNLTISYDLDKEFNNVAGFICGGYLANALDQAMSYAMSFVTGGDAAPTLEMKVSFIAAARPGRLIATGSVVKAGKTVGFAEGSLRDERGKLIANASATVQRITLEQLTRGCYGLGGGPDSSSIE